MLGRWRLPKKLLGSKSIIASSPPSRILKLKPPIPWDREQDPEKLVYTRDVGQWFNSLLSFKDVRNGDVRYGDIIAIHRDESYLYIACRSKWATTRVRRLLHSKEAIGRTAIQHTVRSESADPPRTARAIALFLLSKKFSDGTIGDLDQLYCDEALKLYSRGGADLWYWCQIINLIRCSAQERLGKLVVWALRLVGLGSLVALFDKLWEVWF